MNKNEHVPENIRNGKGLCSGKWEAQKCHFTRNVPDVPDVPAFFEGVRVHARRETKLCMNRVKYQSLKLFSSRTRTASPNFPEHPEQKSISPVKWPKTALRFPEHFPEQRVKNPEQVSGTGGILHSHDRTMLSNLGFADPDKKDRRHDLAGQYLAQEGVALSIFRLVCKDDVKTDQWGFGKAVPEFQLIKGSGQYRTTIGFADLVLGFTTLEPKRDAFDFKLCAIEVKINPVPIGDILRQVTLYAGYLDHEAAKWVFTNTKKYAFWFDPPVRWVVATAYDLDAADAATLASRAIHHIRLGARFDEYVKAREEAPELAASFEV